jgi:AcrR family transcriptional regulator
VTVHSQNAATPARGRGRPVTPGRREHLLDVALTLFAERGFHGTSIPDLAAAAGIAQGSIYRHVESKEALVNEVYRAAKQLLATALFSAVPPRAPLRDQFHGLWWALVDFARTQPRAFAFLELHHHGDYLDAESRAVELRVLAPIAQVVEHGRKAGALKALPAPALIVTVWGAFVGMIKAARAGYFRLDDDLCRQVEETSWAAIAAAPAAARRAKR